MSAAESEHRAIVRRYTHEVFSEQRCGVIDEVVAVDLLSHNMSRPTDLTSREEFKRMFRGLQAAFPDLEANIEDIVAEGDKVVTRTTESGTHKGEFAGIDPTGRSFEVEAINMYRIEDGQITENWVQFDVMGMMEQLGLIEGEL